MSLMVSPCRLLKYIPGRCNQIMKSIMSISTVRSRTPSNTIFASCVLYVDCAYYGFHVAKSDSYKKSYTYSYFIPPAFPPSW